LIVTDFIFKVDVSFIPERYVVYNSNLSRMASWDYAANGKLLINYLY